MCPSELEALYRAGSSAPLPNGRLRGTAIVNAGSAAAPAASRAARIVWQGKVIDNECAAGVNKFFGIRAIRANIAEGESWIDSKPATVLDYSDTSLVYRNVRDELRRIGPNLYLGVMFKRTCCGPKVQMYFLLEPESYCE